VGGEVGGDDGFVATGGDEVEDAGDDVQRAHESDAGSERWRAAFPLAERWELGRRRLAHGWLGDGVMVGPGFFEAMGELLHGLAAAAAEDEKTGCCRAHSADQIYEVLHCCLPASPRAAWGRPLRSIKRLKRLELLRSALLHLLESVGCRWRRRGLLRGDGVSRGR
jgi:hypothetical protein